VDCWQETMMGGIAQMQTEILHGIHSVREALLAGKRRIHEILMTGRHPSQRLEDIERLAKERNIPLRRDSRSIVDGKGDPQAEHQGIQAKVSPFPTLELADVIALSKATESPPFLLILDQIMDPQNLGALVRTALCVGVQGVLLPKDRCAGPSPTVSRASAGALEHMPVGVVTNLSETLRVLKQQDIWIAGLDVEGGKSIFEADLTPGIALVVGSEGKGIRPLVRRGCDFLVSLPQHGPLGSLNASAAGAVAMYEVFRQRRMVGRGAANVRG